MATKLQMQKKKQRKTKPRHHIHHQGETYWLDAATFIDLEATYEGKSCVALEYSDVTSFGLLRPLDAGYEEYLSRLFPNEPA